MRNALKISVGVLAGLVLGYAACKRQLEQSYMDRADAEIADMKAHYEKRLEQDVAEAIRDYEAWLAKADAELGPDVMDEPSDEQLDRIFGDAVKEQLVPREWAGDTPPVIEQTRNLFEAEEAVLHDSAPYDEPPVIEAAAKALIDYNQISKSQTRPAKSAAREKNVNNKEHPVVISEEDFMSGDSGYDQVTLTYYAGDNVLCTPDDSEVAGNERLWAVGTLIENYVPPSGDSNEIYIRSPKLHQDYEIIRMEGSYSQEVLGLGDESQQPAS